MTTPAEILKFWFGTDQLEEPVDEVHQRRWFTRDEAFDQEIEERFGQLVESAIAGELHDWRESLAGELALVLVCDQFPRNIYRGTARAFAGDPLALEVALAVIERGDDTQLGLCQRAFLGMPLEHSESGYIQVRSVDYFNRLRMDYVDGASGAAQAESFYQFAVAHQRVIDEFGRYPHRNASLGRESSTAEQEWLDQGGGF
ncbi:DUF924 family protein [Microbulbifer harenosus]|uniref:DUF924 domain-containing protein n=1 Tax=Microbulbifer harenosus TaxID=2576840 RepID=A0ABY2UNL4_9GAMM|nr:DUF924 family protein [Microbulbifer harenosus]TLM79156.1 DUF924 domain-containing protein [Microbulbifer harenosus]